MSMNSDVNRQILLRLDHKSFKALLDTSMGVYLQALTRDPFFFEKTEFLIGKKMRWRTGDWRSTYYTLVTRMEYEYEGRLSSNALYSNAILADPLAVEVLLIDLGKLGHYRERLQPYKPLLTCCQAGYAASLQVLLDHTGLDPSWNNNVFIRTAAKYGRPEVVRLLMSYPQVDPSAEGDVALVDAVGATYSDPINYNLDFGSPSSIEEYTEVVRLLLTDPRVDLLEMATGLLRVPSRRDVERWSKYSSQMNEYIYLSCNWLQLHTSWTEVSS